MIQMQGKPIKHLRYHYPSAKSRVVLTGNYGSAGKHEHVLLSRDSGIRKMCVLGFLRRKRQIYACNGKVSRIRATVQHGVFVLCVAVLECVTSFAAACVHGRKHPCNTLRRGMVSKSSVLPDDDQNGRMSFEVGF